MVVVEREYDFEGSTYGSGGDVDLVPQGSGSAEQEGGSGWISGIVWALIIYGLAIVLALVIPGAGDFWDMVIGAGGEGINWVPASANVRLLVFAVSLLLLSPAGWWGALISCLVGIVLTIAGWWILPADVWGLPFPNWYLNNSVGMYWLLWIATLARSLARS